MVHSGKLYKAMIHNQTEPYTNVRAVYEHYKDKYPSKKLIVTNAHWFKPNFAACGNYKVGGTILSREWSAAKGFSWSDTAMPVFGWCGMEYGENFLGTIPLIEGGKVLTEEIAKHKLSGVGRSCERTLWGFTRDGDCVIAVTTENYTLEQLAEFALDNACYNAIALDGSGSSQWCDGKTHLKGDGRIIGSYLLLWFEREGQKDEVTKKKYTVCLDAGHGGSDRANGSQDGTYKEHEFTLDMAERVKALLEPYVEVIMTRSSDTTVSLETRCAIANREKAEVFVSLHSNASGSSNTRGLCVFTYASGVAQARNKLAVKLLDRCKSCGVALFGNGLYHKGFHVLANTDMPAMLIEYGFHTNTADTRLLKQADYRQKLSKITAVSVLEHLGVVHGIKFEEAEEVPATAKEVALETLGKMIDKDDWYADFIMELAERIGF